ncbi:MAG: hypothetical protein PHD01_07375 [Geobacteraceae bacterium]|nr:hypothetical protein [Geobacteraceae bacterium]
MGDILIAPGFTTYVSGVIGGAGLTHIYADMVGNLAWEHAAKRGLTVPLRSSIVRGFFKRAASIIPGVNLGLFIFAEMICLREEWKCEGL